MTKQSWRVGLLFSQTGVTAAVERSALQASLLAIDEINAAGGVLGAPLEAVVTDPQSVPSQYGAQAERLLNAERIKLIFGCYMSSTRKLTIPVVESLRGLLFYQLFMKASNIRQIASILARAPIKIPSSWPDICFMYTATGS